MRILADYSILTNYFIYSHFYPYNSCSLKYKITIDEFYPHFLNGYKIIQLDLRIFKDEE